MYQHPPFGELFKCCFTRLGVFEFRPTMCALNAGRVSGNQRRIAHFSGCSETVKLGLRVRAAKKRTDQ